MSEHDCLKQPIISNNNCLAAFEKILFMSCEKNAGDVCFGAILVDARQLNGQKTTSSTNPHLQMRKRCPTAMREQSRKRFHVSLPIDADNNCLAAFERFY